MKNDPVSRYNDEGNPNTAKVVADVNIQHLTDEKLVNDTKEAIDKEHSLSLEYHDLDISAHKGIITLKGRVVSESEKMTIGDKAAAIAGFGNIVNQLQVVQK